MGTTLYALNKHTHDNNINYFNTIICLCKLYRDNQENGRKQSLIVLLGLLFDLCVSIRRCTSMYGKVGKRKWFYIDNFDLNFQFTALDLCFNVLLTLLVSFKDPFVVFLSTKVVSLYNTTEN